MTGKDIIIMSHQELKRLNIIHKVLDKKLKQVEASKVLELSDRQVRRIIKRVLKEGDTGLIHKARGRRSNRSLPEGLKKRVMNLYRKKYYDFGPTLANEKLFEIENIEIGTQTLRGWLLESGNWSIKRKARKHRRWRERKHHFGQMVQLDGSHHNWFEDRSEQCVLMGYIDDATNTVYARFYGYEGTKPAMDSFKRYVIRYGLPYSVYLDRHTTYKSNAKPSLAEELGGGKSMSQFERALKELGVKVIYARSAPAKGRIERLFRTFQDRVVKEMRLKGIKDISGANKFLKGYLPVYNKKFSVNAVKKGNFHRTKLKGLDLDRILRIKTERVLRNDFTVADNRKLYQVLNKVNAKKVTVEESINGKISITYKGKSLKYRQITVRPLKNKTVQVHPSKKPWVPPLDHPWKKYKTVVNGI